MQEIRNLDDIAAAPVTPAQRELARRIFGRMVAAVEEEGGGDYDPDADGHMAILDPEGTRRELLELASAGGLEDVPAEGVQRHAAEGMFVLAIVPGGDFGITVLVPDAPDLDGDVRRWLLARAEDDLLEDAS